MSLNGSRVGIRQRLDASIALKLTVVAVIGAHFPGCSQDARGSRMGTGGGMMGGAGMGGAGMGGAGTGGTPEHLPACQAWPEPLGPAFSLPLRSPVTFESVRRAADGRILYGVGTWTNAGLSQRSLIRSTDDGQSWCPLAMPAAPVMVVPAPADDLILWAVTGSTQPDAAPHDIFRSVDGGASWQNARGNLRAAVNPLSILLVGPTGGDVAWIGTNQGPLGGASTRDGGHTWSPIALAPPAEPLLWGGQMAIDPTRPNQVLIARRIYDPSTNSWTGGFLTSADWGATWSDIASPPTSSPNIPFAGLVIDRASVIYATDTASSPPRIWRSADGGGSWRATTPPAETGLQAPIVVDGGARGHLLLWSSVDGPSSRLWETVDSADSWHEIGLPSGFSLRGAFSVLVAGPEPGQLLVSTPVGLQGITGAGATWSPRSVLPAAASAIAVSPAASNVVWALTPGGALRSSDGGRTWKVLPGTGTFVDVALDPVDPSMAFAIDRGVLKTTDGGETWRRLPPNGSPPRRVLVSPDGELVYAVTDAGIESSEDQGATWAHALRVDVVPAVGLQVAVSSGTGRHAVVLAAQRSGSDNAVVVETWDAGATIASTRVVPGLAGQLRFTSIAMIDHDVILVGGQSGILRSADRGATWVESNQGIDPGAPRALPGAPISSFFVPTESFPEVWALDGRAFRSRDGGVGWIPWPAPVASIPGPLSALVAVAGDPRPGMHMFALASPDGAAGKQAGGATSKSASTLLQLRP